MKTLLISLVSALLLIFCACEKQETESLSPQTLDGTHALKSGVPIIETPLEFTGIARYYAYSVKEKRYIKSPDEGGPDVTAVLTHKKGQDYLLVISETVPVLPFPSRIMEIDVKITPGGVVTFSWPEEWIELGMPNSDMIEQIKEHMGYVIQGPGINKGTLNYKGTFDGERLIALSHFMGEQVQPGTFGEWFKEIVDGPIKVEFLFDLTVNE